MSDVFLDICALFLIIFNNLFFYYLIFYFLITDIFKTEGGGWVAEFDMYASVGR